MPTRIKVVVRTRDSAPWCICVLENGAYVWADKRPLLGRKYNAHTYYAGNWRVYHAPYLPAPYKNTTLEEASIIYMSDHPDEWVEIYD